MTETDVLADGEIQVLGRLPDSSNNALLCEVTDGRRTIRAVYKPTAGERPLWDFPDGTLTRREMAAAVLDKILGWALVPASAWRTDGPAGPGLLQEWVVGQVDLAVHPAGQTPTGWRTVLRADSDRGPIDVAHAVDRPVQRMILFDAVANNADRKGGHLLRTASGDLRGIDHGVTFNVHDKLRTVLWGLAGEPVPDALRTELAAVADRLDALRDWVTEIEVQRTRDRLRDLVDGGTYPTPGGNWPHLPWPLV